MEKTASKAYFPNVKDGDTFEISGIEFIKFPDMSGMTPVVTRNVLFRTRFGNSNNLAESEVLQKLENEFLPGIADVIGDENIETIKTDLTTLDGLKPYGVMESRVSLPTLDFYRDNVGIFDKHEVGVWWWLATPESAPTHSNPDWVVCVSPSGLIYVDCFNCDISGVRPFLLFKSSIFESSEE